LEADKIPEVVVLRRQAVRIAVSDGDGDTYGGLAGWDFVVWLRLDGMDHVREFYGVLNEEDGNVVSDNVPVSFQSVEFACKATNISYGVLETVNDDP
jgi:hypothetical protein